MLQCLDNRHAGRPMMECFVERVGAGRRAQELQTQVFKLHVFKMQCRANDRWRRAFGRLLMGWIGLVVILGGGEVMGQSASNQHYEWVHYQQV
ncbi:MAG: hypothetical protein ACOVNV_03945, partial [Pirellulaceae bacterium]